MSVVQCNRTNTTTILLQEQVRRGAVNDAFLPLKTPQKFFALV